MIGYIKLFRQLADTELWTAEPFSRGQAWVDLIMLANYKDGYCRVRGARVDVKRGQTARSIKTLAARWQWSIGKVNRFLGELKNDMQIEAQKTNLTTLITIINYDKYQSGESANDTADEFADGFANDTADRFADGKQTGSQTDRRILHEMENKLNLTGPQMDSQTGSQNNANNLNEINEFQSCRVENQTADDTAGEFANGSQTGSQTETNNKNKEVQEEELRKESTKKTPVPSPYPESNPDAGEEVFLENFELKPDEPKEKKTYLDNVHPDAREVVSNLCGDLAGPWKENPGEFKTPYAWVTSRAKMYPSPALAAALTETHEAMHRVRNFSRYANNRVFILNQKLNAEEHRAEHERLKSEPANIPEGLRDALEKAADAVKF